MSGKSKVEQCANCGETRRIKALGLCNACYTLHAAQKKQSSGQASEAMVVSIDFTGHEAMLAEIKRASREQLRPLEYQILATLKAGLQPAPA